VPGNVEFGYVPSECGKARGKLGFHMDRLSPAQVEAFFRQGYLVVEGLFTYREVVAIRDGFDRILDKAKGISETADLDGARFVVGRDDRGRPRIDRVVWCGAADSGLLRVGADSRLLSLAAQLLGSRRIMQLINQAHYKLPGDGLEFPWHQDSHHRRYGGALWNDVNGRGSYVQTVLAVDPAHADNGPLRLIPGSSRGGHRDCTVGLPADLRERDAIAPALAVGSVMLFGPYTFHASAANRSSKPRRVLINGYASPGANARHYPGCGLGRDLIAPRNVGSEYHALTTLQ